MKFGSTIQQQGGLGGAQPPSLVQTGDISRDNHGNAVVLHVTVHFGLGELSQSHVAYLFT